MGGGGGSSATAKAAGGSTGLNVSQLNDKQKNYLLSMNNTVNSDIQRALVNEGIRQTDAFSAVSDLRFTSSSTEDDIPRYVTAYVDVSPNVSPSGLAKATFEIQYDFNERILTRSNGSQSTQYSYKGLKLVNRGVTAY